MDENAKYTPIPVVREPQKLSRNDKLKDILFRYCSDTMSREKAYKEILVLF
jgi:hypothetical protein